MAVISLFGQEAQAIVKPVIVKPVSVKTPRAVRTPRTPKEQSITDLRYEQEKDIKRLRELESQDETGWTDMDKMYKGKEANSRLVKAHIYNYQKQIEKLQEPFNPLLNKWKEFIVNLCVANNQAIDKIWFDVSAPYECEINVRLAGHRCWNACVEFRFEKNQLKAYDSNFGGGTSWADGKTDEEITNKITEIMKRVFNKECSNDGWESRGDREGDKAHRLIIVAENGWRTEVSIEDYMSENEKEDRAEMLLEVNEKGFKQDGDNFIYWTHYGKKENNLKQFEALLNDSFYGLIVKNEDKKVVCGENQNSITNTWIITKDFFEYLKPSFVKVEGKAKWTNPKYEVEIL